MELILLYFALQADTLNTFFGILTFVAGAVTVIACAIWGAHAESGYREIAGKARAFAKKAAIVTAFVGFTAATFPSTQNVMILVGASLALDVADALKANEEVAAIPENLANLLNAKIVEYTESITIEQGEKK